MPLRPPWRVLVYGTVQGAHDYLNDAVHQARREPADHPVAVRNIETGETWSRTFQGIAAAPVLDEDQGFVRRPGGET